MHIQKTTDLWSLLCGEGALKVDLVKNKVQNQSTAAPPLFLDKMWKLAYK